MQVDNSTMLNECPLCSCQNIYPIGDLQYGEAPNFSTHDIQLSQTPQMWKCKQCLSYFVQNTVDADTAQLLYSTGKSGDRWSRLSFEQNKTREVIVHMTAIFKRKGNVLDVGCNTGELLDFARQFGCATSGVEFSSTSRRTLAEKGHCAYATLAETPGEYDVIAAFDLVEHLYDVSGFLSKCREKLSENGRLIILTGNISSLSATVAGVRWWYAQYPEHIVFPTKKYFKESSGLSIEKWVQTYASKSYRHPIRSVFRAALRCVLRPKKYTGLPSIGPDHVLAILRR